MTATICSGAEAIAAVKDNDLVAAHMWGLCGTPGHLFRALAASTAKDLTLYIQNFLPGPPGFADLGYPDPMMLLPHIKKIITPFLGAGHTAARVWKAATSWATLYGVGNLKRKQLPTAFSWSAFMQAPWDWGGSTVR